MKQFITGNILLILCCLFYLGWWIIAFRPEDAVKGMRSGWLLIPAAFFGVAAVITIVRAVSSSEKDGMLLPSAGIAAAGIAIYLILLAGTWLIMKRPVTTELFLIVGWASLAVAEISAMYSRGFCGRTISVIMICMVAVLAVVSLVCYLLYYNLDSVTGYYDGMIPLVIVILMSVILSLPVR